MKFSIKNMIGVMLIISLLTIIFRRFLSIDMIHAFFAPYWVDLWLLNLESVWPFEESLDSKTIRLSPQAAALILVAVISGIISFLLHAIGVISIGIWINKYFFRSNR